MSLNHNLLVNNDVKSYVVEKLSNFYLNFFFWQVIKRRICTCLRYVRLGLSTDFCFGLLTSLVCPNGTPMAAMEDGVQERDKLAESLNNLSTNVFIMIKGELQVLGLGACYWVLQASFGMH